MELRAGIVALVLASAGMLGGVRAQIAETPRLRIVGAAAGLPSTHVFGLDRDRDGYLWIATMDGLARYDGIEMKVWQHDPQDAASLPDNQVQAVHVDARDRVWIGTLVAGVAMLDAERKAFRRYSSASHPGMRSDAITAVATHGDDLWIGTMDGLYRIDAADRLTAYRHDPADPASLPGAIVFNMSFDSKGVLWVATTEGLARVDGSRLQRVALPGRKTSQVIYSAVEQGGKLWVGAESGLYVGIGDGRWQRPEWAAMFERPNAVMDTVVDRNGGVWLASQRGAWRVPEGGVPMPLEPTVGRVAYPVHALELQDDGALWVPVFGEGLGYLRSDWRRVAQFSSRSVELAGDSYRALVPATEGGVWLLAANGAMERLDRSGVVERMDRHVSDRLRDVRPRMIARDEDGRFWIAGNVELLRLENDGRIDDWTRGSARDPLLPGPVQMLATAPGHRLWVVTHSIGVQLRDSRSGKVLRNFEADVDEGFNYADLDHMEIHPDGGVWLAGVDGLDRLDPGTGRLMANAGLRGSRVAIFGFDGPDLLWLHRDNMLQAYRHDAGTWRRVAEVTQADGLPAVLPLGLRVDRGHRVWMSTPRGLYRWDPQARHMQHIGVQHGLGSQEFHLRSLALDADGMLVGSTIDGDVVAVDTEAADVAPMRSTLRLQEIAIRRDGQWVQATMADEVVLAHHEQEFRITMRQLAYDDPQGNRYWSRLEGHDTDWVAQGASGERVFSGLAPGHYRLHLRAMDPAGNASVEQQVAIRLSPPWWRSNWAMAMESALLLLVVWWAAAAYRQRLRRRSAWQLNEHKREVAEQASLAKTRFLATLGHEVRTPMTGVLGMSELLLQTSLDDRQRGYAESMQRAGQHLMQLVNDALDLARIEADRLELEHRPFDLHALVRDIVQLSAPLAAERDLGFVETIAEGVPQWVIGDVVRVRQILFNLLGNAIKFTERGEVGLEVQPLAPQGVRLIVSDTGPGLNEEQMDRVFRRFEQGEGAKTAARYGGSGLGLAICQELTAAMEGRIEVDSTPGRGTRFLVALPLPTVQTSATRVEAAISTAMPRALNLLLVEDDPTVAEVICGLLAACGHRVTHAANGLAALAEIAGQAFDLALLDLDLPGVDGLTLVGMLRGQDFAGPIVAVTARADAEAEPLAMQSGFDGFLRKPVTGAMLADSIEAAFARVQAM